MGQIWITRHPYSRNNFLAFFFSPLRKLRPEVDNGTQTFIEKMIAFRIARPCTSLPPSVHPFSISSAASNPEKGAIFFPQACHMPSSVVSCSIVIAMCFVYYMASSFNIIKRKKNLNLMQIKAVFQPKMHFSFYLWNGIVGLLVDRFCSRVH